MEPTVKKSDVWKIPFTRLKLIDGFNIRSDYGDIKQLADSIKENGVKVPLQGYKDGEHYVIVDGHRRYQALTLLHERGIEVMAPFICEPKGTNDEHRVINMILANEGKSLNPLELAEGVRRLLAYGWTEKQIGLNMAKSAAYVNKLNLLNSAPKKFLKIISAGEISATLAIQIVSDGKIDEFMERYDSGAMNFTGKDGNKKKITKAKLQPVNSWKMFKKFTTSVDETRLNGTKEAYDLFYKASRNEATEKDFAAFFNQG